MTNIGYDFLLKDIESRPIPINGSITFEELQSWLIGYKACLDHVTAIIKEHKESANGGN